MRKAQKKARERAREERQERAKEKAIEDAQMANTAPEVVPDPKTVLQADVEPGEDSFDEEKKAKKDKLYRYEYLTYISM